MLVKKIKPLVLIILDGFGYREAADSNAIAAAYTPTWDRLRETCPNTLISGSGRCVGLPDGQMGNSEVGHLTIGSGRIIHQDLTRINQAIESGDFFENDILRNAFKSAKQHKKAVHLMGLVSPGGVHSHDLHFHAALELAAKVKAPAVYLHAFLDGRDTPPCSAKKSLDELTAKCKALGNCKIASVIGRYYAMDRDKRWDRIEKAYDLITLGQADYHANTAQEALQLAYERGETDEFVKATTIGPNSQQPTVLNDGDIVIFMNFRADRARELTEALIDPHFSEFDRTKFVKLDEYITLTEYDARFPVSIAFPSISLTNILGEYIGQLGLHQLRIAETEKYAHVTFFFNGGIEQPFPHEDRVLIPSPKVKTYDLKPEMSAPEITDRLIQEINRQYYDLIICNFANPDMVGHTGIFAATVKAIETIDHCLDRILQALKPLKGEMIITADHGNAEKMFDYEHNQPHTAHTSDPVPFLYVGRQAIITHTNGNLADISPTLLYLLGIAIPEEMTGTPLVKLV